MAITMAGMVLSHPEMPTKASSRWPRTTSSTESAITSRLTSEAFMPSVPMAMPSVTVMLLNSMGVPPAARIPSFTFCATVRWLALQGVISIQQWPTPTSGRARAARSAPSTSTRLWERGSVFTLAIVRPGRSGPSLQVEDLAQVARDRAAVGVRGHQVLHRPPPALAHLGGRDGLPSLLALDLGVGEQVARLRVEVDGVAADAVREEHVFQLAPDRGMPPRVLLAAPGMDRHPERLPDHRLPSLRRRRATRGRESAAPAPPSAPASGA